MSLWCCFKGGKRSRRERRTSVCSPDFDPMYDYAAPPASFQLTGTRTDSGTMATPAAARRDAPSYVKAPSYSADVGQLKEMWTIPEDEAVDCASITSYDVERSEASPLFKAADEEHPAQPPRYASTRRSSTSSASLWRLFPKRGPAVVPTPPPATTAFERAFLLNGEVLGSGINGNVLGCIGRDGKRYAVKATASTTMTPDDEIALQRAGAGPHIVPVVAEYRLPTREWIRISQQKPPPGTNDSVGVRLVVLPQYHGDAFDRWERAGQTLAEETVKKVATQLATAVARLHSRGIVHRDIKPENILMANPASQNDWVVALCDFGMATCAKQPRGAHNFTMVYAAPELVERYLRKSPEPYTGAVDSWSLGVVIFLLMFGAWPFRYSSNCEHKPYTHHFLKQIQKGPKSILLPRNRPWTTFSPEAKNAICGLLQADPAKRLSVAELLEHPWLKDSQA